MNININNTIVTLMIYRTLSITVLSLILAASAFGAEKKLWAKSYMGEKAPKLEVEEWLSEKPDMDGKFVLIDFWATWCGPCRKAIPELNTFHEKFGDQLVVIGISNEAPEKVRKMTKPEITYFSAIHQKARTKKAFEVKGIPHVVIINPKGIVVWEGYPLLSGHKLTEEVVAELLKVEG